MPREKRSRSRSPHESSHHSRHHRRRRSRTPTRKHDAPDLSTFTYERPLPFKAGKLSKHDLESYKSLLASYLEIQKSIVLEDIDERELRGRWKSFTNKWNRGELPEGWYDPTTKSKADEALAEDNYNSKILPKPREQVHAPEAQEDKGSDDEYGPAPAHVTASKGHSSGPTVPSYADLADRDAILAEDRAAMRKARTEDRKLQKRQDRERLDELAPRAEPGTKERQLEKKREAAASARAFRDGREAGGGLQEVDDSELMGGGSGGGEGGLVDARRVRAEHERRRSEREIKREEALRARKAEREERLAIQRAKEQTTIDMLKAVAKERFG